jgi:DNA-binding MarR family transcriptional regulator
MLKKTVILDPRDLESIERVLCAISDSSAVPAMRDPSSEELLHFARLVFTLRHQRIDFLHRAMLGEPAFDMLLSLYTAAEEDDGLTLARLCELSRVPQSSGLRWIDYLCSKKLIARKPHPTDKRASLVHLTEEGRTTLNALFTAIRGRLMEFISVGPVSASRSRSAPS